MRYPGLASFFLTGEHDFAMYVVFSCFMRDKFLFQGHGFEFFEQNQSAGEVAFDFILFQGVERFKQGHQQRFKCITRPDCPCSDSIDTGIHFQRNTRACLFDSLSQFLYEHGV